MDKFDSEWFIMITSKMAYHMEQFNKAIGAKWFDIP